MSESTTKDHWENIYVSKQTNDVSWWQDNPKDSLGFIHSLNLPKTAKIIDIGGGDSKLVDYLLDEGFENLTVLDISEQALNNAKKRLGDKSIKIKWIVSNVTEFRPPTSYDLWHDRAAFHFLTTEEQIEKYLSIVQESVSDKGYIIMATFSTAGPEKCSGLHIKQYNEETLTDLLSKEFEKIRCTTVDHTTPFNTKQNFLFCSFKKLELKIKA
jgi:cyclopropane fatty-acyl-phospholipid synthase-like methyltransferase